MKKLFLTYVLLSIIALPALFAQNIGVRAGFSVASLTGSDAEQAAISQYTDAVSGFNLGGFLEDIGLNDSEILNFTQANPKPVASFFAGAYLNVPVLERFQLEPGLFIASRGYRVENDILNTGILGVATAEITNRSYYLELPLYARLFITENLNIYGGPQFSLLLSNEFTTRLSGRSIPLIGGISQSFESDGSSNLNKFDVGVSLGLGYELPFGFNVQAGYDLGVVRFEESTRAYNGVWKLSAGLTF